MTLKIIIVRHYQRTYGMKTLLTIFALALTTGVFAHDLSLAPYIRMQESLAKDDLKGALDAHKVICAKELLHYKDDYKDCAKKFKSIEEVRTSFKTLSEVYLKNGNKKEMEGLQKATCPMAEAKWVQKKGELANPYYGKSMLTCGEKI
jgi:hypothetical protein